MFGELVHDRKCASVALCRSSTLCKPSRGAPSSGAQNDPMSENGLYIREWRKLRDMSQDTLEAATGIDRTQISKLERGKVSYTQGNLEAIARALNIGVRDLYRDPSAGADVVDIWDHIPPSERSRAMEMLRIFSNKK